MSEWDWKPVANQGKHDGLWCNFCIDLCGPSDQPCQCCSEAESAVLRIDAETAMAGSSCSGI